MVILLSAFPKTPTEMSRSSTQKTEWGKAGRTRASVEVLFEHNDKRYIAKRFNNINGSAGREFVVARIDDGSQITLDSPDTFINTVIPREMASHFLFDGEHAEVFLGENNRGSIKSAVRDILGCSLIETAIDDLQAVSNQFRKQIPSTKATNWIEELNSRHDSLSAQIETAKSSVEQLEKKREETNQQITDIDAKLRNTAAAKELQQSRDRLTAQLIRAKKRQKDHTDEVYKWLGENGSSSRSGSPKKPSPFLTRKSIAAGFLRRITKSS